MNHAVRIQGLNLYFGEHHVLRDISLDVPTGHFFAIIGPNGSGKTTLLRAMVGLQQVDSGTISIAGRLLSHYSRRELAREVAVVPQYLPVDFPFTVAETVLMGRTPHLGLAALEKNNDFLQAEKAMAYTDITHLARRRLDQLSGGELQRVVIARALCQQTGIMLLDEPTASLDPAHQIRIMDLMEQLRQEKGITVIMVSHDLNLAAIYGNHILLMKDGAVQKQGPPREVLTETDLQKSYGCRILVDKYPLGAGGVRLSLVPGKYLHTF